MGLFNKYSISILLVTLGSLANAELFNYDYVDFKAGTTSSKAGDREYSLEVSKSIHRNIALRGAVQIDMLSFAAYSPRGFFAQVS